MGDVSLFRLSQEGFEEHKIEMKDLGDTEAIVEFSISQEQTVHLHHIMLQQKKTSQSWMNSLSIQGRSGRSTRSVVIDFDVEQGVHRLDAGLHLTDLSMRTSRVTITTSKPA